MNMKKYAILSIFISILSLAFADTPNPDLYVYKPDLVVEERDGNWKVNGVDLYIRKKEGMKSVMLVETTKDPNGKMDNFAYRAEEYNSVNGDEIRYLNGEILQSEYAKYSLISSTVVQHPQLGDCFHIYIPKKLVYGYPWERHGTVEIERGLFINIRTFEKKYCDYSGAYADNPFMFDYETLVKVSKKPVPRPKPEPEPVVEPEPEPIVVVEPEPEPEPVVEPEPEPEPVIEPEPEPVVEPEPEPEPVVIVEPEPEPEPEPVIVLTDDYNQDATTSFNDIADKANGKFTYSKGPDSLSEDLYRIVEEINPKSIVDIVFAIDATGSMKDDIQSLRERWLPRFQEQMKEFDDLRIGLVFYRDYGDNWKYKQLPVKLYPFTDSFDKFTSSLKEIQVRGSEGGDIPEPVYEALYASVVYFDWRDEATKKVILVGDAPPHSKPRGSVRVTKDTVMKKAQEKGVTFDCVIVPDGNSKTKSW